MAKKYPLAGMNLQLEETSIYILLQHSCSELFKDRWGVGEALKSYQTK